MIRICHLITGLDVGGAEMSLARLVSRLDRSQFEPTVISMLNPGHIGDLLIGAGVPVTSLGMRRGFPSGRAMFKLVNLLKGASPDILQTWLYHADLLGSLSHQMTRRGRLVWNIRCSDMTPEHGGRPRLVQRALAAASRVADAVVVNSAAGRHVHTRIGYRPRRWVEIPNGVDTEVFRPRQSDRRMLRRAAGLPESDDTPIVGYVARFDPMKDHGTFLDAAAHLIRVRPDVHFALVGLGCSPDHAALRDMVAVRGLSECVHLLGLRTDIHLLFPTFDIATLTSAYGEGFPNVLIEAMACGVPCVATDVGDSARIIGQLGRVIPPRDPVALSGGWNDLLGADLDALGGAARHRVETHFSLDRSHNAYEQLYMELAEANPGKA
jgi:glycosyltransferase involved in cell wall biosynthesis